MSSQVDVPDGWSIKTIEDVVVSAKNGGTPKRSNDSYWGGEIEWLSSGEIVGKEVHTAEEGITEEGLSESSAKIFPKDSVLVAMYGKTRGQSTILRNRMSGNQAICCLEADEEKITPEYLLYYLKNIEKKLKNEGRGGGQTNINQSVILNQTIPVPSLNEQKRIVEAVEERLGLLERLEKSVENIDRLVNEYENSLVMSLILDEKSGYSGELPSTEDLPESWSMKKISDICSVNGNYTYPEDEFPEKEFDYISVSEVDGDTGQIIDSQRLLGKECSTRARRKVSEGDVIVSTVRPYLRAFALVPEAYHGAIASTAFAVLTAEDEVTPQYLYRAVRSPLFVNQLKSKQKGASYPEVRLSEVKESVIPVPPRDKQEDIVGELNSIDFGMLEKSVSDVTELFEEYENSILAYAFQGRLIVDSI
jgi:type I restriction enzyme S subunit